MHLYEKTKDMTLNILEPQLALANSYFLFSNEGMSISWTLYMCKM